MRYGFFSGFANLINAMRSCSKLLLDIFHGKAVGEIGWCTAACGSFATTNTAVKLPELANWDWSICY
jgi:methylglutaconyl-CoA hydratase